MRFSKKRIFWYVVAAGLVVLGWQTGWWATALTAGMLAVALGLLALFRWVAEDFGMARLRARSEALGAAYPAMIDCLRSAHSDDGRARVRFAVYGDTRSNRKTAALLMARMAEDNPDAVFHTGDIVRFGTPREFIRNHLDLLSLLKGVPVFCVPGNHDRGFRRKFRAFRVMAGDDRFAFDLGCCRFIGFNNSGRDRVSDEMLSWLDQVLSRPGAARKFVFFHIPPAFFEAVFAKDRRRRGFRRHADTLHELFRFHGVDEVFMAHIHGFATHVFDGVRYTLTAGGGAPLSGRLERSGQTYHYLVLEAGPEGISRKIVRPRFPGSDLTEWLSEPYGEDAGPASAFQGSG